MLRLPPDLREAFKEPLGRVYTDPAVLLRDVDTASDAAVGHADGDPDGGHDAEASESDDPADPPVASDPPLVAVGDVVTFHLRRADRDPDVMVVDGRTKRDEVDPAVSDELDEADYARVEVENPPAELSEALLDALVDALAADHPVVIYVDGEEDLATLPAIVAAPLGGSVVYGQPDEGMVHVPVTEESKAEARDLLVQFDGDVDAALAKLTSNL